MRWIDQLETSVRIKNELSKEHLVSLIENYETKFDMYEEELTSRQALDVLHRIEELKQEERSRV